MARAGSRISDRRIARVRAGEVALTRRVNAIFDDADVVLTPGTATGPPRVGAFTFESLRARSQALTPVGGQVAPPDVSVA
jgi:Asp-tRNA(Asn)/Glu-tRNA(Gln) amidotransferase A subunit family amidase